MWSSLRMTAFLLIRAEDECAGAREGAAGAVDAGKFGIRDLALAAFTSELPGGFDEEEHAVHAGVGVGEAPAGGVEREVTAGGGALPGDEGAPLTGPAEAEGFQSDEGSVGKGVVDLDDVDVFVADAGHREGARAGDGGGGRCEVGHVHDRLVRCGFARAEDPDGWFLAVLRTRGADDDDRAAGVCD